MSRQKIRKEQMCGLKNDGSKIKRIVDLFHADYDYLLSAILSYIPRDKMVLRNVLLRELLRNYGITYFYTSCDDLKNEYQDIPSPNMLHLCISIQLNNQTSFDYRKDVLYHLSPYKDREELLYHTILQLLDEISNDPENHKYAKNSLFDREY